MTHSNIGTNIPVTKQAQPENGNKRCDELPVQLSKLLSALTAAMVASVSSPMPSGLKEMVVLLFVMIAFDTLFAVYAAAYMHEVQSRKLVDKLVNKGVVYAIAGLLGYVACALTDTWLWQYALVGLLMAREASSLIETANKLMRGGKNFGLLEKFLTTVGAFFAERAEQAISAVVKVETPTATVVVAPAPAAEVKVTEEGKEG